MTRIRVDNKAKLRDALETIILKKLEKAEQEHERELEKAELEKQKGNISYYNFMKRLKPVAFEFYPLKTIKLNIPWVCPDAVADWLFFNTNWQIVVNNYVSPPSSLLAKAQTKLVCKKAGAYPIQEGRINSWIYPTSNSNGSQYRFSFRVYRTNDMDYGYDMGFAISGGIIRVYLWKDNSIVGYIDNPSFAVNTWMRRQVKFYVSEAGLVTRWERWDGTDWVQEGQDIVDPENRYYGAATNYAGLSNRSYYSGQNFYADDTEIWKAS